MPDFAGIHPIAQQMMQDEPDKKANENRFKKRREIDSCTDNQVLERKA